MKKLSVFISILLCFTFLFNIGIVFADEDTESTGLYTQSSSDQREDVIFAELNELALQKNMAQHLISNNIATANNTNLNQIASRMSELENELEMLGWKKIDPNNSEDIAHFTEVTHNAYGPASPTGISTINVTPPNNETLATLYDVFQYNGTYKVDGVTYDYSRIVVTDSKGTGTLTQADAVIELIDNKSSLLSDLLSYNFNFGISEFLARFPGEWAVRWTLGNVFTALNSYNESTIVSGRGATGIYAMTMGSVTQMSYIFVYIPGYHDWVLCGSYASDISLSRGDTFTANIDGEAVTETNNFGTVHTSSGRGWNWYIDMYFENSVSEYSRIGSLTIKGKNTSVKFTPAYFNSFMGLY